MEISEEMYLDLYADDDVSISVTPEIEATTQLGFENYLEQKQQPLSNLPTTMHGTISHFRYRTEEFAVALFAADELDGEQVVIVGPIVVDEGIPLKVSGKWQNHDRYGRQLRVQNYARAIPRTPESLTAYLGSGLFKGIGPYTAQKVVEKFGMDTIAIMNNDVERLTLVNGIKATKLQWIRESWQKEMERAEIMETLFALGISPTLSERIFARYGRKAAEVATTNPYLFTEMSRVSFKIADRIARAAGIPHDSPGRIEAGVTFCLGRLADGGHVCVPREELVSAAVGLLEVDAEAVEQGIDRLVESKKAFTDLVWMRDAEGRVEVIYSKWAYRAETDVAERLLKLATEPSSLDVDVDDLPGEIAGVTLSDRQLEAVKAALTDKVVVITGGPGTGKTTIVRSILEVLQSNGVSSWDVAMAAPTGRAAKRMSEVCDFPAYTIHRLLGAKGLHWFEVNENNPLDAQVLIVDEMSMVDLVLFDHLLRALPDDVHLVLVGDADQLPSVGPGCVLLDLVESGAIPTVRLDTIFRQAQGSSIVVNSHRINRGEMPLFPQDYGGDERQDFYFFSASGQTSAANLVANLVAERIPDKFGCSPDDIQVLSPMRRRGEAAANALNKTLQAALNPANGRERAEGFRAGDRVIQTRNDYSRYVFNGEIGTVANVDAEKKEVTVVFDDRQVTYPFDDLYNLDLAYALSIHKSQGSEYPVTVIVMLKAHYVMLRRTLLYTAVTRARERVVIVGERAAIQIAVSEARREKRYSGLLWRLDRGASTRKEE